MASSAGASSAGTASAGVSSTTSAGISSAGASSVVASSSAGASSTALAASCAAVAAASSVTATNPSGVRHGVASADSSAGHWPASCPSSGISARPFSSRQGGSGASPQTGSDMCSAASAGWGMLSAAQSASAVVDLKVFMTILLNVFDLLLTTYPLLNNITARTVPALARSGGSPPPPTLCAKIAAGPEPGCTTDSVPASWPDRTARHGTARKP